MATKYRLIEVTEVPSRTKRSMYGNIMKDFLNSKASAAKVEVEKRKPISVYQGLQNAKKLLEIDDVNIKTRTRLNQTGESIEEVYLERNRAQRSAPNFS
jgi:hypothetical protein